MHLVNEIADRRHCLFTISRPVSLSINVTKMHIRRDGDNKTIPVALDIVSVAENILGNWEGRRKSVGRKT